MHLLLAAAHETKESTINYERAPEDGHEHYVLFVAQEKKAFVVVILKVVDEI